MQTGSAKIMESDLCIVGGGLGGCAAALRAAEWGCRVALFEPCDWIGGQVTSQGVSALDEHRWIEQFGATANYYRFRNLIRSHYQKLAPRGHENPQFNPGLCWVSRLAFEPWVALAVLESMLAPHVHSGLVRLFTAYTSQSAKVLGDRLHSVTFTSRDGATLQCRARCFIDASELGDLLPLAGAPYRIGAEDRSETGEPHAPQQAQPHWVQSFTFPFIVEFRPGERHVIAKPANYEKNRAQQPYTLNASKGAHGHAVIYKMFAKTADTPGSFWAYRRLVAAEQFSPHFYPNDLSMINWHSNDYRGGSILDVSTETYQRSIAEAKALSLGFLYWLQTEAPRDEGGSGYPELKLRPDLMGTVDGLSQQPYIRESRRIRPLQRICEQDITAALQPGVRARLFPDSVAIGHYWLDIHKSLGESEDFFAETRPFQVPLGALIPAKPLNLIAGAKNIGTTHLSNGACRLHPIEWAIGEAAGALAAESLQRACAPRQIHASASATRLLQLHLAEAGAPLFWFTDVPHHHPAFAAVQWLAAAGVLAGDPGHLSFNPDMPLQDGETDDWLERAQRVVPEAKITLLKGRNSRAELAQHLFKFIREKLIHTNGDAHD